MPTLPFRLVNVFTRGSALSGNPLCLFEDGGAVSARSRPDVPAR